jgi:hypothetical protein
MPLSRSSYELMAASSPVAPWPTETDHHGQHDQERLANGQALRDRLYDGAARDDQSTVRHESDHQTGLAATDRKANCVS